MLWGANLNFALDCQLFLLCMPFFYLLYALVPGQLSFVLHMPYGAYLCLWTGYTNFVSPVVQYLTSQLNNNFIQVVIHYV